MEFWVGCDAPSTQANNLEFRLSVGPGDHAPGADASVQVTAIRLTLDLCYPRAQRGQLPTAMDIQQKLSPGGFVHAAVNRTTFSLDGRTRPILRTHSRLKVTLRPVEPPDWNGTLEIVGDIIQRPSSFDHNVPRTFVAQPRLPLQFHTDEQSNSPYAQAIIRLSSNDLLHQGRSWWVEGKEVPNNDHSSLESISASVGDRVIAVRIQDDTQSEGDYTASSMASGSLRPRSFPQRTTSAFWSHRCGRTFLLPRHPQYKNPVLKLDAVYIRLTELRLSIYAEVPTTAHVNPLANEYPRAPDGRFVFVRGIRDDLPPANPPIAPPTLESWVDEVRRNIPTQIVQPPRGVTSYETCFRYKLGGLDSNEITTTPPPRHHLLVGPYQETQNNPFVLIKGSLPSTHPLRVRVTAPAHTPIQWRVRRSIDDHPSLQSRPVVSHQVQASNGLSFLEIQPDQPGMFHIEAFVNYTTPSIGLSSDLANTHRTIQLHDFERPPYIVMNLVVVAVTASTSPATQLVTVNPPRIRLTTGPTSQQPVVIARSSDDTIHLIANVTATGVGRNQTQGLANLFTGWVQNLVYSRTIATYRHPQRGNFAIQTRYLRNDSALQSIRSNPALSGILRESGMISPQELQTLTSQLLPENSVLLDATISASALAAGNRFHWSPSNVLVSAYRKIKSTGDDGTDTAPLSFANGPYITVLGRDSPNDIVPVQYPFESSSHLIHYETEQRFNTYLCCWTQSYRQGIMIGDPPNDNVLFDRYDPALFLVTSLAKVEWSTGGAWSISNHLSPSGPTVTIVRTPFTTILNRQIHPENISTVTSTIEIGEPTPNFCNVR